MNNKKILFAISRLTGGGAEHVVSLWANMLSVRGYDVSIMLAYRADNEYAVSDKVDIITIANSEKEYLSMKLLDKISTIRKILSKKDMGCVIPFLPAMQILIMFSSFGLKCKRIDTIRVNPWEMSSVSGKVGKMLWKLCFITSNRIIVQTSEQSEFFSAGTRKKCIVIPNPIGEEYYNKEITHVNYTIQKCVAVGRVCAQKNYEMMLEGFSNVVRDNPNCRLDIYGAGESGYLEKIQALIRKLGLEENVHLKGRHNNMDEVYPNYDVFCMTSDFEGLPNALIEAMASGLVCISTDCKTGPKDLICDGDNGFLISVGNAEEFAETLFKIDGMTDDELSSIANKARECVLNLCSEKKVIGQLCSLIDTL